MPIILFGSEYWNSVVNFKSLVEWGVVSPEDLSLFRIIDSPQEAFDYLRSQLEELYLQGPSELEDVKVT